MKKEQGRKLTPAEYSFMAELFANEYKNLLEYATRMLKGALAAEDLVQDTFYMACLKINIVAQHPKPGAWLNETLQKNIMNYWRMRDTIAKFVVNISMKEWVNFYQDINCPEDDLDFLYGNLAKCKEYEILKKFAVYGYSQQELAEEYQISINCCKQRIYRAKNILREILENIQ